MVKDRGATLSDFVMCIVLYVSCPGLQFLRPVWNAQARRYCISFVASIFGGLKGIVRPFESGDVTKLIRSGKINGGPVSFYFLF